MRQDKIILLLEVIVVVLSIVLMTGIGYASETDSILRISDNSLTMTQEQIFKIGFTGEPTYKGNGAAEVKLTGPTTATMNIEGLQKVGDYVTVIYTIINESYDINADVYAKVTNTNKEYFNVTAKLSETRLKAKTGKTTLEVTVELIKSPIYNEEITNISTNIVAKPVEEY